MRIRQIGKVVYIYALFVAVAALSQTFYDSSRHPEDMGKFAGLGFPHNALFYPAVWAGNFAEKFTALEQACGFAAIFVLLGIVVIVAKIAEQRKPMEASHGHPAIDPQRPATIADKIWCVASHLAVLLGIGFFLPVIVYGMMGESSEFVASNAKEAMMFQVSLIIYFMGGLALAAAFSMIFVPLFFALGIGYLVFSIIASIKASKGQCYHYPITLRLLRSLEVGRVA